jgi:hypothetical protein
MTQANNIFISRAGGLVYVCNTATGQKLIVDDPKMLEMSNDDLIKLYCSLNIFKSSNERRC